MDQCFSRTLIQIFPYLHNVPKMELGELDPTEHRDFAQWAHGLWSPLPLELML